MICDHTIALTVFYSKQGCPRPLRRIRFKDPETGKKLVFITNHLDLEPLTESQLYKMRWQVELLFKWIKQHLSSLSCWPPNADRGKALRKEVSQRT